VGTGPLGLRARLTGFDSNLMEIKLSLSPDERWRQHDMALAVIRMEQALLTRDGREWGRRPRRSRRSRIFVRLACGTLPISPRFGAVPLSTVMIEGLGNAEGEALGAAAEKGRCSRGPRIAAALDLVVVSEFAESRS